jgi:hypothetical protein
MIARSRRQDPSAKMHSAQWPYRELLRQLDDRNGGELEPMIRQWLATQTAEAAWLEALGRGSERGIPAMAMEDSWRLYALSRVSDALIQRAEKYAGRTDLHTTYMKGLGLRPIAADCFHPFYHEVVEVTPAAAVDVPITITKVLWPGYMCGPLLISRAGVSVIGGAAQIRKDIAETSTLYWCYRRAGRPTEDLSLGWGGNSQWRTSFRRDYFLKGEFYYNVADDHNPRKSMPEDLEEHEQLELLRHRCFVLTDRPHADLFPYKLRHHEPMA